MTGIRAALRLRTIRDMLDARLRRARRMPRRRGFGRLDGGARGSARHHRASCAACSRRRSRPRITPASSRARSKPVRRISPNHDSSSLKEFKRLGAEAHQLQRRFAKRQASRAEVSSIAAVDARLVGCGERVCSRAQRSSDLGRSSEAQAQAHTRPCDRVEPARRSLTVPDGEDERGRRRNRPPRHARSLARDRRARRREHRRAHRDHHRVAHDARRRATARCRSPRTHAG